MQQFLQHMASEVFCKEGELLSFFHIAIKVNMIIIAQIFKTVCFHMIIVALINLNCLLSHDSYFTDLDCLFLHDYNCQVI